MAERLLFVPTWAMSPAVCEEIPAVRTALDDFRLHFSVDVFCWPWIQGGMGGDCSWLGQVAALRESITESCHLVVMGTGTATALLAASPPGGAQSLVAAGMVTPAATLEALGHTALAGFMVLGWEGRSVYQYVRLVMEGAPEEDWDRYTRLMDGDINWARYESALESWPSLNLLQEKPDLQASTLYLDSPLRVAGYADQRDAFLEVVPHAEVAELEIWPGRMHEKKSGRDLSQKAIGFIQRHSAAEDAPGR